MKLIMRASGEGGQAAHFALRIAYEQQRRAREWMVGASWRLRRGNRARTRGVPKRVVIVLTGLLGDSVMCTPVLVEARRLWPAAHLTLLGRRHNLELLRACPLIDDFHEAEGLPFSMRDRHQVRALEAWLRDGSFDTAIILLGDEFAGLLARAGIPVRVGRQDHRLSPALTHTYDIGSARTWGPSERLGALRVLGLDVGTPTPTLWVDPAAHERARERLAALGVPTGAPYIAVHPFGRTPAQWWPIERVGVVAETVARDGLPTVLLGDPKTSTVSLPHAAVLDARGRFDVAELVAALADATLVVSTDSGPFHIAAALRRPCVALFRSSRPEHAHRYQGVQPLIGQNHPCEEQCRWDRCSVLPCRELATIDATMVTRAVQGLLIR
jgi:ADP-heptose:LPS heptosyltransferase